MTKSIKLIKSHLTQDDLRDKKVKYVNTLYCKSIKQEGNFLLCETADTCRKEIDKSLILAIVKVKNCFKTVEIESDEITMIALFKGRVYRFASDLEYKALTGLFPSTNLSLTSTSNRAG